MEAWNQDCLCYTFVLSISVKNACNVILNYCKSCLSESHENDAEMKLTLQDKLIHKIGPTTEDRVDSQSTSQSAQHI